MVLYIIIGFISVEVDKETKKKDIKLTCLCVSYGVYSCLNTAVIAKNNDI